MRGLLITLLAIIAFSCEPEPQPCNCIYYLWIEGNLVMDEGNGLVCPDFLDDLSWPRPGDTDKLDCGGENVTIRIGRN